MKAGITGTPGTGKTEVCKLLKRNYECKIIDLNALILEKKFYTRKDSKRETLIADLPKLKRYLAEIEGDSYVIG